MLFFHESNYMTGKVFVPRSIFNWILKILVVVTHIRGCHLVSKFVKRYQTQHQDLFVKFNFQQLLETN